MKVIKGKYGMSKCLFDSKEEMLKKIKQMERDYGFKPNPYMNKKLKEVEYSINVPSDLIKL